MARLAFYKQSGLQSKLQPADRRSGPTSGFVATPAGYKQATPLRFAWMKTALLPAIKTVELSKAIDDPSFPLAHSGHFDLAVVLLDAEFFAPPKVICDFSAVDEVFARQTSNVGT